MSHIKGSSTRKADHSVDPLFVDRWSPRAMSGETLSEEELMTLFEAARWAPSSFNEQPWKFMYAMKDDAHWKVFFNLLDDFNQSWCKNAAVLVCLVSAKNFVRNNKPNRNHLSDAGAAWENLALQGHLKGLVVHGMAGYDVEKTRKELQVPDDHEIVHMFAIGKPGTLASLPESLRSMEKPNDRKPLHEFVFKGRFERN